MSLTWQGCSEIVCGKVILGEYSSTAVRPEIFFPPYNDVIKIVKNGITDVETLVEMCGWNPIQVAIDATKDLTSNGEINWIAILERECAKYDAGYKLEKIGKKLQKGEEVDWSLVKVIEQRALQGVGGDFVPMADVQSNEMPMIETGWKVIDEHIGGLPEVGLIVVGADPGVGKTTWMLELCGCFAEKHEDKRVAIFSPEMTTPEVATRSREIRRLPKSVEKRILINDYPVSVEEIINKAASIENLGLLCVDYADLLVRGDNNESAYAHIYRTLMLGAKQLHCPIVLLAQLVKYGGGLPKPKHLRYTKMAEALAWMILMLYNPATDFNTDAGEQSKIDLPTTPNTAFILVWKIRGGFRKHPDEAPGAIQLPFKGEHGWHLEKSRWFSLKKG